jgi:hypothetical protein
VLRRGGSAGHPLDGATTRGMCQRRRRPNPTPGSADGNVSAAVLLWLTTS